MISPRTAAAVAQAQARAERAEYLKVLAREGFTVRTEPGGTVIKPGSGNWALSVRTLAGLREATEVLTAGE